MKKIKSLNRRLLDQSYKRYLRLRKELIEIQKAEEWARWNYAMGLEELLKKKERVYQEFEQAIRLADYYAYQIKILEL